jgi:hypothetical protein
MAVMLFGCTLNTAVRMKRSHDILQGSDTEAAGLLQ